MARSLSGCSVSWKWGKTWKNCPKAAGQEVRAEPSFAERVKDEPGSNVTVPACTSRVTSMSPRGDWWGHRGQPGSGSSELLSQPGAGDERLTAATLWDTKHTFHPSDPVILITTMTELVPHSFSLLEVITVQSVFFFP